MAPEGQAAGGQGDTNSAGAAGTGTLDDVAAAAAAAAATPSADAIAAAEERAAADKIVADAATEKAADDKATQDAADAAAAAAKGGKPGDEGKAGGDTPKAPDTYVLQVPDGFENQQAGFEAMARRQNLTNEQAQTALDTLPEQYRAQSTRLLEETEAHAEVGGEKLEQAQLHAKLVLDKFLPADSEEGAALRDGLNITGYGNWVPLVLLLSRIGNHFAEDRPPNLEGVRVGSGGAKDPASVLYDNPASVKADSG